MATKEETIPAVTRTWKIQRLEITRTGIQVVQDAAGAPSVSRLYEDVDFAELLTADVGDLLGLGPKGLTLGKLAQDLAIAIMVDRGDEVAGDWT